MPWQNPKTNWTAPDGVRDVDMNRIEGNILELYNQTAREGIIVYVNASGNDDIGTGSSSNPFRTITKALSILPKNLAGMNVIVYITEGTYDEDVVIKGFYGGNLTLMGLYGNANIRSLSVTACTVACSDLPLVFSGGTGLHVSNGGVLVSNGSIIANGNTVAVRVSGGSVVHIDGTVHNNNATAAVVCTENSRFYAFGVAGAGMLNANMGSTIAFDNSALPVITASGGRINTGSQGTGLNPATIE